MKGLLEERRVSILSINKIPAMTYWTLNKKKKKLCNFLIMFFLIFSELSFRLDEHIKYFQGFTSSMEVSFYHLVRGVKYSLYIYHHWLITYPLKMFFLPFVWFAGWIISVMFYCCRTKIKTPHRWIQFNKPQHIWGNHPPSNSIKN